VNTSTPHYHNPNHHTILSNVLESVLCHHTTVTSYVTCTMIVNNYMNRELLEAAENNICNFKLLFIMSCFKSFPKIPGNNVSEKRPDNSKINKITLDFITVLI